MKPTINAKRAPALDEDELRELSDLSFSSVIADIANATQPAAKKSRRSQREIDLESTHTDRTINELLALSEAEADSEPKAHVPSGETAAAAASDATEDMIAPDILFPELTLKS